MPTRRSARMQHGGSIFVSNIDWYDDFGRLTARQTHRSFASESTSMSRSRRAQPLASSGVESSILPSPGSAKRSIRLTVKAPPSKLREVTSRSSTHSTAPSREALSRTSKNKPPIVESWSEDEEEEEDDDDGEEELDQDVEAESEQDEEQSEEDVEMEDPLPVKKPTIKISAPGKPSPRRLLKQQPTIQSVEDAEMMETSALDNEELSEAESQDQTNNLEDDEEEEQDPSDLDAENKLIDEADDTIAANNIGEDELDSDIESTRSGTPDLSKLTARQRASYIAGSNLNPSFAYDSGDHLLALPIEAQKRKFFTAEQISMRKQEMARRRKDLSDKRNQEQKDDTLKRLLTKQPPKRKSRAQILAEQEKEEFGLTRGSEGTPAAALEESVVKPSPLFARTVISHNGTRVAVPEEWLGTPLGRLFDGSEKVQDMARPIGGPRLVEVVE